LVPAPHFIFEQGLEGVVATHYFMVTNHGENLMTFWIIKHTDENKFIQFKGGSPYWTTDRFAAAVYESAPDAEIQIRHYGIPYVIAVARQPLRTCSPAVRRDTNVPSDFWATGRDCPGLD
jgi:hypothetical protein